MKLNKGDIVRPFDGSGSLGIDDNGKFYSRHGIVSNLYHAYYKIYHYLDFRFRQMVLQYHLYLISFF